ncbi:hypothetical protein [Algibacillus agarilyticus]|uniref:hypothetical protein n=1 Tax=Algibacillus agarilyticus TaxID=2234133 RepID=UPI000DD01623|nr:hypothetical protein [Algibacillus agarilyticus]
MKLAFVFVCQGGELAPQASLLAASLDYFLRIDAEVIAAVPNYPEVFPPSKQVIQFLKKLNVRIEYIDNHIDRRYLIANKLSCFNIQTEAEQLIFLDSDIMCMREFREETKITNADFAARLTDLSDLTQLEWQKIYQYCHSDLPHFSFKSSISNEDMPLCFNSGIIVTTKAKQLYAKWVAYAKHLNKPSLFPKCRPFLDQISLPFAVSSLGLSCHLLNQDFHWSLPLLPINSHKLPQFVHYHEPIHLLGDDASTGIARLLIKTYPELKSIISCDPILSLLNKPNID